MVQVLDNGARIQYTTLAAQTVFVYPFLIFEDTDLLVYLRGPADPVDPPGELLTLNVDYTVQGVDQENGGTITLTVAAAINSILTIERKVPATQLVDFTVGGKFTGETLNFVMDKLTLLIQQVEMLLEKRGLLYLATEELGIGQTTLPKLPPNTGVGIPIWSANGAGNLVGGLCDETTTCSTLRTDLLSQTQGAPGTDNVGFYDPDDGGVTLTAELIKLLDRTYPPNPVIGGDFGNNPWQRDTTFAFLGFASQYTADRVLWAQTNAAYSTSIVKDTTDVPLTPDFLSQASFKITNNAIVAPAAGDLMNFNHRIEGYRIQNFISGNFTVSFWVKSNKTGIYNVAVMGNSTLSDRYISEFSVNSSGVWEFKSINVVPPPTLPGTWNFDVNTGMQLSITLAAGANRLIAPASADTWISSTLALGTTNQVNFADSVGNEMLIQAINIRPGINSNKFIFRSAQEELFLCQRYFEKSYNISDPLSTITKVGAMRWGGIATVSDIYLDFMATTFKVTKRATPVIRICNPNTGALNSINLWDLAGNVSVADRTVVAVLEPSESNLGFIQISVATPLLDNEYWQAHWLAESEL